MGRIKHFTELPKHSERRTRQVPGSENSDSHRPSCATSNSPSTRLGLRQGLLTSELRVQTEHACSPCSQNHSGRSRSRLPMGSGHGLSQFFDTVNHSRLIRKLSLKIKDGRVISLIHKMLRSGVQINGEIKPTEIGLMQGGPLSPLLANIYLDELDKELEKRGHRFARYADDLICICKSRRAAERTLASLTRFVQDKMLLKVNQEKSHVSLVTSSRTKFLGYGFYFSQAKGEVRLTIHKKSKQKLKDTIRQLLTRNPRTSIENVKQLLAQKLRGWMNYFQLADAQRWTQEVDRWIRRRIRQLLWKTWKKVKTRIKALIKLGADPARAYYWGCTRKGYWRISNSHILATTLTTDFLKQRGWSWLGCYKG